MSDKERLSDALDAALPEFREKIVADMANAYTRGRVEAACFLRDTFAREGDETARLVCSNYACLVLVHAKLATFEDLQRRDRELVDFLP